MSNILIYNIQNCPRFVVVVQSIISYETALEKKKKSKREACWTEQWSVTDHTAASLRVYSLVEF